MRTLESRRLPAAAVTVVLALCAIVGFGTGVTSHIALRALALSASAPTGTPRPTDTPTPALSPSPSPTLPATLPPGRFTLTASATPNVLSAGESFTVSVQVVAADGVTPVGNAVCYLQAPHSKHPLFSQWPAPQTTTADGKAAWTLTAPSVPPGVYGLEVIAYGQHWQYSYDFSVTLRS